MFCVHFRDSSLCEAEHKTKHQRGEVSSKGLLSWLFDVLMNVLLTAVKTRSKPQFMKTTLTLKPSLTMQS
jgi:hypothetical protein